MHIQDALTTKSSVFRGAAVSEAGALDVRTLGNGLRVVIHADHRLPLVHLQLYLRAGAREEPAELGGLAHLCEHLVFQGAGGARGVPGAVNRLGGTSAALTSHDWVCFADTLPADRLDTGLALAAQRLGSFDANPASLETHRSVLHTELLQRRERLHHERAFELVQGLLYPAGHPYSRPPAGTAEGIAAITCDDAAAFFAAFYQPRRAVLVLLGDLHPDAALAAAERALGGPAGDGGETPEAADDSLAGVPAGAWRRLPAPAESPELRTYVAYRFPGLGTPGGAAAGILARAIAIGRTSPLARDLSRSGGGPREVRVILQAMRDATTVTFLAIEPQGSDAAALESDLLAAIERNLAAPLLAAGLERSRKRALLDHYAGLQSLERRAAAVGTWLACGRSAAAFEDLAAPYRDLVATDLVRLAERYCDAGNRAVLTFEPAGGAVG